MNPEQWYNNTYIYKESDSDLLAILADADYRSENWVPAFNQVEFLRAQMELVDLAKKQNLQLKKFFSVEDPRLNSNWVNSQWDDYQLDQWWQYVVKQYHKYRAQLILDSGMLDSILPKKEDLA